MKKILYTLLAGAIALVSCSKSDDMPTAPQSDATTFTLAVDGTATRATSAITPARYIMEVWSEDGQTAENVFENGATNHAEITSGSAFTVTLDKTKAYTCLFWADDNVAFNAASLKAISLNTGKDVTEAYFSKVAVAKGKNPTVAVTLKRAVAKIKLTETATVKTTDNLVLKLSNIYPTFDVLTGTATGTAAEWTKTVKPASTTGVIGTFYFFAKTDKELSDFKFTYGTATEKTVTNIPVQQNFATNIKGEYSNVSSFTFTVTADDEWRITPEGDKWDGAVANSYGGGDGSQNSPYLISSAKQLALMAKSQATGAYYLLTTDINLDNRQWTPIGYEYQNVPKGFCGHFDGGNHAIYGLKIASHKGEYSALFSQLCVRNQNGTESSSISNLNIIDADISVNYNGTSNTKATGILVAWSTGAFNFTTSTPLYSTITNCHVSGKIAGTSGIPSYNMGGLIGYAQFVKVDNCTSKATIVNAPEFSGALGGRFNGCDVNNCSAEGSVSGGGFIGGFIGCFEVFSSSNQVKVSANMLNCSTTASVTSDDVDDIYRVGGFTGLNNGVITGCTAKGDVRMVHYNNSYGYSTGGFVGLNNGTIKTSSYLGTLSYHSNETDDCVGGFVGTGTGTTVSCSFDGTKNPKLPVNGLSWEDNTGSNNISNVISVP